MPGSWSRFIGNAASNRIATPDAVPKPLDAGNRIEELMIVTLSGNRNGGDHDSVAVSSSRRHVAVQPATPDLWNDEGAAGDAWPQGVRLKHASVPAARILVIEDNGSDVFLLQRALNKQDLRFQLVHLPTGGQALAFIHRERAYADVAIPNLILVDLNLSKYSGEEILREIRASRHLAGVAVCVWSSSRSRRDEALLKDLGVTQFITKPCGLDQFMEIGKIIKGLLANPRSG